jgi:hypothetical protein
MAANFRLGFNYIPLRRFHRAQAAIFSSSMTAIHDAKLVCGIHRQLFFGLCKSHFDKVKVTSDFEIAEGGQSCQFLVIQIS